MAYGRAAAGVPPADPLMILALASLPVLTREWIAVVYARWDGRSQAIVSKADYVQRHRQCPGAHNASRTEDDSPGPDGAWVVHYEIGGQQLTDYRFYAGHRWVFDPILSNPDMVPLYRMSPQQFVSTRITASEATRRSPCEQVIDVLGDVAAPAVADPDERR